MMKNIFSGLRLQTRQPTFYKYIQLCYHPQIRQYCTSPPNPRNTRKNTRNLRNQNSKNSQYSQGPKTSYNSQDSHLNTENSQTQNSHTHSQNFAFWRWIFGFVAVALVSMVIYDARESDQVPFSGRKRVLKVPSDWEQKPRIRKYLLESSYKQLLQEHSRGVLNVTKEFEAVLKRLVRATPELHHFDWSVYMVRQVHPNVVTTPYGQIFFNDGMAFLLENEDELAAVLAHEMGHVVARHIAERMGPAIDRVLQGKGIQFNWSAEQSQLQEMEADSIGLILMSRACYDPRKAAGIWEKIKIWEENYGGDKTPITEATHPATEIRIEAIRAQIPKALKEARNLGCHLEEGTCNTITTQKFWQELKRARIQIYSNIEPKTCLGT